MLLPLMRQRSIHFPFLQMMCSACQSSEEWCIHNAPSPTLKLQSYHSLTAFPKLILALPFLATLICFFKTLLRTTFPPRRPGIQCCFFYPGPFPFPLAKPTSSYPSGLRPKLQHHFLREALMFLFGSNPLYCRLPEHQLPLPSQCGCYGDTFTLN